MAAPTLPRAAAPPAPKTARHPSPKDAQNHALHQTPCKTAFIISASPDRLAKLGLMPPRPRCDCGLELTQPILKRGIALTPGENPASLLRSTHLQSGGGPLVHGIRRVDPPEPRGTEMRPRAFSKRSLRLRQSLWTSNCQQSRSPRRTRVKCQHLGHAAFVGDGPERMAVQRPAEQSRPHRRPHLAEPLIRQRRIRCGFSTGRCRSGANH